MIADSHRAHDEERRHDRGLARRTRREHHQTSARSRRSPWTRFALRAQPVRQLCPPSDVFPWCEQRVEPVDRILRNVRHHPRPCLTKRGALPHRRLKLCPDYLPPPVKQRVDDDHSDGKQVLIVGSAFADRDDQRDCSRRRRFVDRPSVFGVLPEQVIRAIQNARLAQPVRAVLARVSLRSSERRRRRSRSHRSEPCTCP